MARAFDIPGPPVGDPAERGQAAGDVGFFRGAQPPEQSPELELGAEAQASSISSIRMSDSWSRNSRAKEAITAASCPRQAMPCSLPKPNLDSRGRFALRGPGQPVLAAEAPEEKPQ